MINADSFLASSWKRLRRNKLAIASLVVIFLSILLAIFAYFIAPDSSPNANRIILEIGGQKPGFTQQFVLEKKDRTDPARGFFDRMINGVEDRYFYIPITHATKRGDSLEVQKYVDKGLSETRVYALSQLAATPIVTQRFRLGTDKYGHDILSRLIVGIRVSLSVGLITVLLSLSIGILLGAIAGYYRGVADELIMWLINIIWSIPTLLLVFAITLVLGKGFWQVFIAVGLTMWVNVARLVRGQVLAVREFEYIEAARALGYSNMRIIFKHILPNIIGPVLVIAASNFASAIVIEAGLSFLGIGVQPPQPSWGLMIKENYNFIITSNPMLALAPGFAIMILVLAFNLLGNGMRDAFDVKTKI